MFRPGQPDVDLLHKKAVRLNYALRCGQYCEFTTEFLVYWILLRSREQFKRTGFAYC